MTNLVDAAKQGFADAGVDGKRLITSALQDDPSIYSYETDSYVTPVSWAHENLV